MDAHQKQAARLVLFCSGSHAGQRVPPVRAVPLMHVQVREHDPSVYDCEALLNFLW